MDPYARMADKEAEEALIGCILVNPDTLQTVRDLVSPDDFHYYPGTWKAILHVVEEGKQPDIITLDSEDPMFLTACIQSCVSWLKAESYAKHIHGYGLRRRMYRYGQEIATRIMSGEEPADVIGWAGKTLKFVDDKIGSEVHSAGEVASDLWEWLDNIRGKGRAMGLPTPWIPVNAMIGGLVPGELSMVASRPSMGKSQLAIQIADFLAKRKNKVLYYAIEGTEDQILRRICYYRNQINGMKFRAGMQDAKDEANLANALADIMKNDDPLYIYDRRISLEEFVLKSRIMDNNVGGLDLIIVDYLQLFPMAGLNPVQEIGNISSTLKDLAAALDCPVLATVQLSRASEGRSDRRPNMADLRGSGIIEQDADLILGLHRSEYYNPAATHREEGDSGWTEIWVLKQRDGVRGTHTKLWWNAPTVTFREGHTASLITMPGL